MLPTRVLAIRSRAFTAPKPCLPRRQSSPSLRRRKMAGEENLDGYPRNRGSPHIREGVHAAKPSVHCSDKATPLVVCKSTKEKENLQMVLGPGHSPARAADDTNIGNPERCEFRPFDICSPLRVDTVKLNPSLLELNRDKRKEIERAKNGPQPSWLQPGMILLKSHLKQNEQVEIIRQCQRLGVGPGGFYLPGYRDGAKMSLQMMCLGKNWDPQTKLYQDKRPTDGAEAPQIPEYFKKMVEEAIQASHALIKKGASVEKVVPKMSPDLCIVNFYNKNGKLGLHQDRDESPESINRGLPVVSFSLGDAADFLYGESRDLDKAAKIKLENGDVLIFGGKSRSIFHGISCIHPGSAPKWLIEETKLRPGRLNLTFRQF